MKNITPPKTTTNKRGNPEIKLTKEHLNYLHKVKTIRDESFQTLWYDKETTAYNQTSSDVHLKGSMGEYALAEYANLQMDVSPRENGDNGADHEAIILAPNYPNKPVTIDTKTASWSNTPPLLVRVDIDPDADYYVNAHINENTNTVTLQGIASRSEVIGNKITHKAAIKKLTAQYQNFADWQKQKCRNSRNWPSNIQNPEAAIEHIINHSLNHGHDPLRSTVSLSIYGHLNYELSMWELNEIPQPNDFHCIDAIEKHHRNTNVDELLEDLRKRNQERNKNSDTNNDNSGRNTTPGPSPTPDTYSNGTPVHLPN